jgi:hypothetical protein
MGFGAADRVLKPESLPITEPLLPAITRPPEAMAANNAKVGGGAATGRGRQGSLEGPGCEVVVSSAKKKLKSHVGCSLALR